MSDVKTELPDEADIIADNERLTAENTRLKADLEASQALTSTETARANKAESDLATAKSAAEAAEKRATEAESKATTAKQEADEALKVKAETDSKMADFNKSVATEVARLGIRHEAAAQVPASVPIKTKSATEKLLELKGVKSLAELAQKNGVEL